MYNYPLREQSILNTHNYHLHPRMTKENKTEIKDQMNNKKEQFRIQSVSQNQQREVK